MRKILGSILAIAVSSSAYAETLGTPRHPAKAPPCVTVADLNRTPTDGVRPNFEPVPTSVYDLLVAEMEFPKGTKSLAAAVVGRWMIIAPLDDKGCSLGTHVFTEEELAKLLSPSTPPTAAPKQAPPDESHDGEDHV